MKNDHKQNTKELRQILNEWDFIGVYPFKGGPKDEYDCLINPIIAHLTKNISAKDLDNFFIKELNDHFGLETPKREKIDDVTEKIITWWNSKNI